MTKASDSAEPFGPELKAEGLVAGHQSLRKDVMTFSIEIPTALAPAVLNN
jgi:hypothetical protein